VSTSVVKWSEVNRVSIKIRRYTDHMKFYSFFHILSVLLCFIVYMVVYFVCFYLILYIMYFLLCLCILIVMYVPF
jgi:type IV secretory pathway TrbL component